MEHHVETLLAPLQLVLAVLVVLAMNTRNPTAAAQAAHMLGIIQVAPTLGVQQVPAVSVSIARLPCRVIAQVVGMAITQLVQKLHAVHHPMS